LGQIDLKSNKTSVSPLIVDASGDVGAMQFVSRKVATDSHPLSGATALPVTPDQR